MLAAAATATGCAPPLIETKYPTKKPQGNPRYLQRLQSGKAQHVLYTSDAQAISSKGQQLPEVLCCKRSLAAFLGKAERQIWRQKLLFMLLLARQLLLLLLLLRCTRPLHCGRLAASIASHCLSMLLALVKRQFLKVLTLWQLHRHPKSIQARKLIHLHVHTPK